MKTITLKADEKFDAKLSHLAKRMKTTKSAVIREAVGEYHKHLDRQDLARQIREASLKTRDQAIEAAIDFEDANDDGL